jgi:hypothetical protein
MTSYSAKVLTELYPFCRDCKESAPLPFMPCEDNVAEYRDYALNQPWWERHRGHDTDYTEKLSVRRDIVTTTNQRT